MKGMVDERRVMATIIPRVDYGFMEELYFDSDGKIYKEYNDDDIYTKRQVLNDEELVKWIKGYVEYKNKEIEEEMKNDPERFKKKVDSDDDEEEDEKEDRVVYKTTSDDKGIVVPPKLKVSGIRVNTFDVLTLNGVVDAKEAERMDKICKCGHIDSYHINGNCFRCECKVLESAMVTIDQLTGDVL